MDILPIIFPNLESRFSLPSIQLENAKILNALDDEPQDSKVALKGEIHDRTLKIQ